MSSSAGHLLSCPSRVAVNSREDPRIGGIGIKKEANLKGSLKVKKNGVLLFFISRLVPEIFKILCKIRY